MAEERLTRDPQHSISAYRIETMWTPSGFTFAPTHVGVPPESIVSGQNVWMMDGSLQPRWRLSRASSVTMVSSFGSSNITSNLTANSDDSIILGTGMYVHADTGAQLPFVATGSRFYLGNMDFASSALSFSQLSYMSSGGSSVAPNLGHLGLNSNDPWFTNAGFGHMNWRTTNVFSGSRGTNLLVIAGGGGVSPAGSSSGLWQPATYCCWTKSGETLTLSQLTGAPGAKDAVTFDNRVVLWNCSTATTNQYYNQAYYVPVPIRAQWHVAGDPEDWTGIGSGFEDLADMRGAGTRAFVLGDEVILATEHEIWRGRKVGLPYVFQFAPLDRDAGIPYPRPALRIPQGVVWLDAAFMVRLLTIGGQIQDIGEPFQELLRQTCSRPDFAFFTFNERLNHLRLFYAPGVSVANRSITIDLDERRWFDDRYDHFFHRGLEEPLTTLAFLPTGTDLPTKNQWLAPEILFTSAFTVCQFNDSATSELGSAITEQAVFGPLHTSDVRHLKTLREVRFDCSAPSASTFSIAVSPNVGSGYSESRQLALSAASAPQHSVATFDTTGRYHTLRVQSNDGSRWRIARIYTDAEGHGRER